MATPDDVRRIALSLPDAQQADDGYFAFSVRTKAKNKSSVWVWLERVHPGPCAREGFDEA